MQFRDFDVSAFLRDHWQKQPVFIRNPWINWRNPLDPDELAGLACEEGVESRLVEVTSSEPRHDWKVEHGPLPETRFGRVGEGPWTLLVQAVDHHVPEVAALIAPFRFIPDWRIDDVMVSYAGDGGGVGPHYDQYDVFLIQGSGNRRWRIGQTCDSSTQLLPHDDLRLIADFQPRAEWVLEPGDILYVPPGVAHEGVALGDDCMTYSIGFRAPLHSELIAHFCDDVLGQLEDDERYTDPDLEVQANPGEIRASAVDRLHAMVTEKLHDRARFARWFGQFSSAAKCSDIDWRPEQPIASETLRACLASGRPLCRNPASRFSFYRQAGDAVLLFVDGRCFECADEASGLAERICARDVIVLDTGLGRSDMAMQLLAELIDQGSLAFEMDE